jgi:uncharacterized membrane protein YhaH (DUF805 family)
VVVLSVIDGIVGTYVVGTGYGVFSGIYILVTLVPYLAVCVRRLHDPDRSGWWLLLWSVPLIGLIWLIVVCCLKGSDGENRFGTDPLTP